MIRRDWLTALRLILTLRSVGLERLEDRQKIREFVKPKPRKRRSKQSSSIASSHSFANFFGARGRAASGDAAASSAAAAACGGSSSRPGSIKLGIRANSGRL